MTMAAAGGISPVLALIESGAVDERVFTRHLAEDLGWKWLETPQPETDDMAELKRMIPARFAVRHQVFPVGFERDEATQARRLETAKRELEAGSEADHRLVNVEIEETVAALVSLLGLACDPLIEGSH